MSVPASWRDPGDWPFLLIGLLIGAYCTILERLHLDQRK